MKRLSVACLLLAALVASCDDSTSVVGYDMMPKNDGVTAIDSVYDVQSKTIKVDAVLSNTSTCYLGSIVDDQLHIQTTSGFLAQYHVPTNFLLPKQERLRDGVIQADSCDLRLYIDSYDGDSLAVMKLNVQELSSTNVLDENANYYTNLNVADYINPQGVSKQLTYSVKDLTRPDNETNGKTYYRQVVVKLPVSYGTRIMQAYYDNPSNFTNSYRFVHNVCPGFSFRHAGGTGALLKTSMMSMNVYFSYHTTTKAGTDTIIGGVQTFGGTEEVLQTTHIQNLSPVSVNLDELPYTYAKSPASYFTEMTLPVDEIIDGKQLNGAHYNDSISSAQLIVRCKKQTDAVIPVPTQLFLLRKGEMTSYFENNKMPDSKTSYLSSATSATSNYYNYSNIAPLITYMKCERDAGAGVKPTDSFAERRAKYEAWEKEHPDWNKIVLMPVNAIYTQSTTTYGTTTMVLRSIKPQMGLTSVQLEGGKDNPLQMQVIYSRYNK